MDKFFSVNKILIILLILVTSLSFSQDIQVEKAKHRIYVNGKLYYIHKVKKGETLYSICKAYNVLQKDIAIENPSIFNGLTVGQKLKIPVINDGYGNIDTNLYYIHKVKKGETLYSISRKYKIKVKKIVKANPQVENGLKVGQILQVPKSNIKIPKNTENTTTKNITDTTKYKYHTVIKHETLYSLSKLYNISIDSIKIFNPEIKTKGLKTGMILKLPKKNKTLRFNYYLADSVTLDSSLFTKHTDTVKCDINQPIDVSRIVNAAILLPFSLDAKTKYNEKEEQKKVNYLPKPKPFVEFYQGILASLDSLNKLGININLYTYDTKNDTAEIKKILNKLQEKNINFIIGPAFNSNIRIVAKFAEQKNIPLISPFSIISKKTYTSKNLIQINPDVNLQINSFINNIPDTANYKYIIIYDDTTKEKPVINKYKKFLYSNYSDSLGNNVLISEVIFENHKKSLDKFFSVGKNNLIIIPSKNLAFVYDVITRLNLLYEDYKNIYLFGFPYWKNYKDLDYQYLHRLNYQTLNMQHIDYDSSYIKIFIKDFYNIFKAEPSKFSFLGYDIFKYFSISYAKFGDNMIDCIPQYHYKGFSCGFNFIEKDNMLKNKSLFILQFTPDYNIKIRFIE